MNTEFNIDSNQELIDSATQAVLKAMQEWSAAQSIEQAFEEKLLAPIYEYDRWGIQMAKG